MMQPAPLNSEIVEAYLAAGHWTRETLVERYRGYARTNPDALACADPTQAYSWQQLDSTSDCLAANLIHCGLERNARALVQMPSSAREIVIRLAFKKAGILGTFVPMQWRRREIQDVIDNVQPRLLVVARDAIDPDVGNWLHASTQQSSDRHVLVDLAREPAAGWCAWADVTETNPSSVAMADISERQFTYDEVSLITASSGTSGLSKLCAWPEAAQLCIGRGIAARMRITAKDNVGVFAPMSGAAGLLVWLVSAHAPCAFTFPTNYKPASLLDLAQNARLTVMTTVPVVLTRMSQEQLGSYDLRALRALRVGTAAANVQAARSFEDETGCRVIVASGAMECPGFGHADFDESYSERLNGSVGFPLPGCELRIEDENGNDVGQGMVGELRVRAPFASIGYWNNPAATEAVWRDGWYATGDVARFDADGRLRLLGRIKELINRSGHKILPAEVEQALLKHPDVAECAVVGAPDDQYGAVPWAFVQLRGGAQLDATALVSVLRDEQFAAYKIPTRFIPIAEIPRVSGNKIDKKALLALAPAQ